MYPLIYTKMLVVFNVILNDLRPLRINAILYCILDRCPYNAGIHIGALFIKIDIYFSLGSNLWHIYSPGPSPAIPVDYQQAVLHTGRYPEIFRQDIYYQDVYDQDVWPVRWRIAYLWLFNVLDKLTRTFYYQDICGMAVCDHDICDPDVCKQEICYQDICDKLFWLRCLLLTSVFDLQHTLWGIHRLCHGLTFYQLIPFFLSFIWIIEINGRFGIKIDSFFHIRKTG